MFFRKIWRAGFRNVIRALVFQARLLALPRRANESVLSWACCFMQGSECANAQEWFAKVCVCVCVWQMSGQVNPCVGDWAAVRGRCLSLLCVRGAIV